MKIYLLNLLKLCIVNRKLFVPNTVYTSRIVVRALIQSEGACQVPSAHYL